MYTVSELVKAFKISRSMVQLLHDLKIIIPSIYESSGHGNKNIYSEDDISRLLLFRKLCQCGISKKESALAVETYFHQIANLFDCKYVYSANMDFTKIRNYFLVITHFGRGKNNYEIIESSDNGVMFHETCYSVINLKWLYRDFNELKHKLAEGRAGSMKGTHHATDRTCTSRDSTPELS